MRHKRLNIFLLLCLAAIIAFFPFCPPAYANADAGPAPENMAVALKELGLFIGTDRGFDLDKPCDRLMGAVILTRLLGWEYQAYHSLASHPFVDIAGSYAEHHISYLYQAGLVNGQTAGSYGKDAMTSQQFAALILRALGYEDELDFSWDTALSSLANLGILSATEALEMEQSGFSRAQAVLLCHRALIATPKGQARPLVYNLLHNEVFSTNQLARSGDARLLLAADMPDYMGFTVNVYTEQEFRDVYWLSVLNRQYELSVYAPWLNRERALAITGELLDSFFERDVYIQSFVSDGRGGHKILTYISEHLSLQFYYQDPARYQNNFQFYNPEYQTPHNGYIGLYVWREKLNALVAEHTTAKMSEYEQVKALHDFLVRQTAYDKAANERSSSHFADGVLFERKGVCDGFASAFKMLLNTAGIECVVIYGDAPEGKHAWNQVKIDGEWYNVDVTWAHTWGKGDIYYGFFCAPDRIFTNDHRTERPDLTHSCTSEKYYAGVPD